MFSIPESLFSQDAIAKISISKAPLQMKKDDVVIETDDTDLLLHTDMSWGSIEDEYLEPVSDDSTSTISHSSSSNVTFVQYKFNFVL